MIEIVPALKRVRLKHIGCWHELCMEFQPTLNIITDESRGSGKSTIFRAILQTVHLSSRPRFPLLPTKGFREGKISVELMSPTITHRVTDSGNTHHERTGNDRLKSLRSCLEQAPTGTCILIESDFIEQLDAVAFDNFFDLMSAPPCQVIVIMGQRLKPERFKQARIYSCFWNPETNRALVRLLQKP